MLLNDLGYIWRSIICQVDYWNAPDSQLLSHDRKQEKIIATVISSLIYEPLDNNLTLQDNPTDINTQSKIAQRNMIERFNPLINSFYG